MTAAHVSVVIPTSDRPDDLDRCLSSVAAVRYPAWDVAIIDQSKGDASKRVVEAWRPRLPDVTFRHLDHPNASHARNLGASVSHGEIVAFVDDDCSVRPSWLDDVAAAFGRHPEAPMVFGSVRAAGDDSNEVFVPTYEFEVEQVITGPAAIVPFRGMGAAMYIRRDVFDEVGGFDPLLGPGAKFRSSQDYDLTYRVLASGRPVLETPAVSVIHYGVRTYRGGAATRLVRNSYFGAGATHMKMLRCGSPGARKVASLRLWRCVTNLRPLGFVYGRATNLGALGAFIAGMVASFTVPIDRAHSRYIAPPNRARLAQREDTIELS